MTDTEDDSKRRARSRWMRRRYGAPVRPKGEESSPGRILPMYLRRIVGDRWRPIWQRRGR
jgi:hypothetical protein